MCVICPSSQLLSSGWDVVSCYKNTGGTGHFGVRVAFHYAWNHDISHSSQILSCAGYLKLSWKFENSLYRTLNHTEPWEVAWPKSCVFNIIINSFSLTNESATSSV